MISLIGALISELGLAEIFTGIIIAIDSVLFWWM